MRLSLVAYLLAALGASWSSAHAQQQDLCADQLTYQADPGTVQKFRQQCTIQRLLAERSDAENRVTAAEVQTAVEAAHARAQTDALAEANRRNADERDYWKMYVAGIEKLAEDVDAACTWKGSISAPVAKMCKAWSRKVTPQ